MTSREVVKLTGLSVFLLFLFAGCDTLQENPPGELTRENFYESAGDAKAAVVSVYEPWQGNFDWNSIAQVTFTPSPYATTRVQQFKVFSSYSFDASSGQFFTMWTKIYESINRANAVIDNVPSIDMDEERRASIVAEARFMRALNYFWATRLWGKVPLTLSETTAPSEIPSTRAPIAEVYEAIIADLKAAEKALPAERSSSTAGRATSGAASALLGKVYLTMARQPLEDGSKLQPAHDKLKEVIDSGTYALQTNYADVFANDNELNSEIIFAIQHSSASTGQGTQLGAITPPIDWAPATGFSTLYFYGVTEDLYNAYDSTDARPETAAIFSYESTNGDVVTFNDPEDSVVRYTNGNGLASLKYADLDQSCCNGDADVPMLRYADVLLLYAETENELNGPTSEAFEYLNKVRERASASAYDPSADSTGSAWTQESFRDIIYQERFLELSLEFKSVFTVRRFGRVEESFQESQDIQEAGVSYDPKYDLFPIPQRELDVNTEMSQNPGWGSS